jgi:cyclophilin family peptidyl-prolyl cis-trans isomerase
MGTMVLVLHEQRVPNTVANFVHLASKGFYHNVTFHRIIEDFMIQGGCPLGTGSSGPGWMIRDEFADDLRHDGPGVLSMANAGPDTNGSQFFITLAPAPWLDGRHTVFGRLVKGDDVLASIGSVGVDDHDRPVEPVTIQQITILRDGRPVEGEQPVPDMI